jgi:hypothetical protein
MALETEERQEKMNEIVWLRSHVERCLEDHWEMHPVTADADGDYPFRWGTAHCFVSIVTGDPHFIRVWAFAARVPKRSLKLLAELNEINQRALTAHVYWSGTTVVVEQTMHADGLTTETLGQASLAVGGVADDIGTLLAVMFDGETPHPALDSEDAQDNEDAEEEEGAE